MWYNGITLASGVSNLGSIPSTPTFWACSIVVIRCIRIAETAVRFCPGPQNTMKSLKSFFKSTKSPNFWLVISLVFGVVIGFLLWVLFVKFFSHCIEKNAYFYLFSSIIQGFIGLVAFMGVVVVFQLQEIHERRKAASSTDLDMSTEKEIRKSMTWFAVLSFFNVALSMFFVVITGWLQVHENSGAVVWFLSISLSISLLFYAVWIIRRTIFWA